MDGSGGSGRSRSSSTTRSWPASAMPSAGAAPATSWQGIAPASRRPLGGVASPPCAPARCPPSRSRRRRCGGWPTSRWCRGCSSPAPPVHRAARPRRLARRARVHAGRAQLAAAESACVHGGDRGAARRAVGALGQARTTAARRHAHARAGGRCPGRGAVGVADGRTGEVLAGVGRPVGAHRVEPVAGAAGAARRVGGRGVAGQPARRGGQHRRHDPPRDAQRAYAGGGGASGDGHGDDGLLGLGSPP